MNTTAINLECALGITPLTARVRGDYLWLAEVSPGLLLADPRHPLEDLLRHRLALQLQHQSCTPRVLGWELDTHRHLAGTTWHNVHVWSSYVAGEPFPSLRQSIAVEGNYVSSLASGQL